MTSLLHIRTEPNQELCEKYAQFASHMVRWQFKIVYWVMFVTNLLVLFFASWTYTRYTSLDYHHTALILTALGDKNPLNNSNTTPEFDQDDYDSPCTCAWDVSLPPPSSSSWRRMPSWDFSFVMVKISSRSIGRRGLWCRWDRSLPWLASSWRWVTP